MAKPETKEKKAEKKTESTEFKYGIDDVAEGLGIKSASARVQLRNHNIKKAGKSYGWNSKAEVEEVVKKIKNSEKAKSTMTEKKAEKPVAKKAAEPAKKAKKEAA